MGSGRPLGGLAAQRRALTGWLRGLSGEAWTEEVRAAVEAVCRRYAATVEADVTVVVPDDPQAAADVVDRVGAAVELAFADTREDFGNKEGGLDTLVRALYEVALRLGAPTPPEARDAAVAAVVWRAADKVEAPVRIILESGGDFVVGAGEPEAVLRTDHDAVLEVAGGRADPAELARSGRWRFEGPDDARQAFERTFRL